MPLFEIDIPTELANLLAVEAERRGLAVDGFLTQIICAAVAAPEAVFATSAAGDASPAPAPATPAAASPPERTLARIFARTYVGPNLPISLNSLILDWARAKADPDDLGQALVSYQERGWLRRAGDQDVILTDAGFAGIQRI